MRKKTSSLVIAMMIAAIAIGVTFSCKEKEGEGGYFLEKAGQDLVFELDRATRNTSYALFPYTDKDGKEYLTFLNQDTNDILFYSMADQSFCFKITADISGNNGVGFVSGYYIHTLDSIFLTARGLEEISLIDREARVLDKFMYEFSSDDQPIQQYKASSRQPAVFKDSNLYLLPYCNRWTTYSPMCVRLNVVTREVYRFPLNYPKFEGADNRAKLSGVELNLRRCFNGEEFVYSFDFDERVYVTSIDQSQVERKLVKSRYVDEIILPDDYNHSLDLKAGLKLSCERSNYGQMLYDPYREVYYRVAFPKTEIEPGVNPIELHRYGRKFFSIVIADKDLNVIGETLFPEYRYNSNMMFVRPDGLYISASHSMASDFSDDELRFHRFELKRN